MTPLWSEFPIMGIWRFGMLHQKLFYLLRAVIMSGHNWLQTSSLEGVMPAPHPMPYPTPVAFPLATPSVWNLFYKYQKYYSDGKLGLSCSGFDTVFIYKVYFYANVKSLQHQAGSFVWVLTNGKSLCHLSFSLCIIVGHCTDQSQAV